VKRIEPSFCVSLGCGSGRREENTVVNDRKRDFLSSMGVQKAIRSLAPFALSLTSRVRNQLAPKSALPLAISGVLRALSFQVDAVE
jgi:hypothetical protein